VTTGYCTTHHRHHTHTTLHMTEKYAHNTRYHPPTHTQHPSITQHNTHTHTHHHPRTRHATHVNDPRHAQYKQLIPALNTHNNTSQTQHRLHHYPAPTHMRTIHLTYRTGHAPTTHNLHFQPSLFPLSTNTTNTPAYRVCPTLLRCTHIKTH
jgi:hypothetical protein